MPEERVLFVTGRLAETSLRRVLAGFAAEAGIDHEVAVLGINVAALMHADWVSRKLEIPSGIDRVVLPGWCQGDAAQLSERFAVPFELGPKDLHELPQYYGRGRRTPVDLSRYDIEILAEINHAPRLTDRELLSAAASYRANGADVIDVGCIPGEPWSGVGEAVRLLRFEGYRVSIDSFERAEVEAAVEAGAELVLSCNGGNVEWAAELDAELVVIPDDPRDLDSLIGALDVLSERNARFRVDPILEPIGCGFAASLARYFDTRRRWPEVPMLMGVGNLTEMTEVDSAGVTVLLAGICQELGIGSVLTTEVINWGRTAVREFDLARRMVAYSERHGVPPKHLDAGLAMLRDPKLIRKEPGELERLAAQLRDPNFRIFVDRGELHLMNRDGHWSGTDPYEVFDRAVAASGPLDADHAFYLGYELAKAATALALGKQYLQDEALRWGFLTVPEPRALERRHRKGERRPH